jgi:hypothetical protein
MTNDAVKELFERCKNIEGEVRLLQGDKKQLFEDFKDRVSPKVFNIGRRIARMKAKLKPSEVAEVEMVANLLEDELTVETVD